VETKVDYYKKHIPIFDTYGIETALDKGISKVVNLDCGGTLVFDETEALVAIDINTGHFVGKKSQEETIFTTNMEAAEEIPRQLRLRDIGGIIIIDFIDMEKRGHRKKVFETLKKNLKRDKAESTIFPISELGLVEMTRKRVKKSLKKQVTQSCPYCEGTGYIYSNTTQVFNIIRTLKKAFWVSNENEFMVVLNQDIFYSMINDYREALDDLEKNFNRKIYLSYSEKFHHNDIKIVSLQTKKEIISNLSTYEEDNEVIF
jgi:ribonuclease G